MEEGTVGPGLSMTSEKPTEMASLAHSTKQQPGSMYGTNLGHLHMCDSCVT